MDRLTVQKRNFKALLFEGTFFFGGLSFLNENSVIAVFIYAYTGSLKLAGLAAALKGASSIISQLLIGPYVPNIKNSPRFITRVMFSLRPLPLLMIPVLLLSNNPNTTATIFIIVFSLLWASDGAVVVPWMDLMARTIPASRRGRLIGNQMILGGIFSLFAGLVIKIVLDNPHFTNDVKFSILFGLAGLVLLISAFAMSFAKDLPERVIKKERVRLTEYFRKLPSYLKKNKNYSRMTIINIITHFSIMLFPITILFSQNTFNLSSHHVSTLIYLQLAGSLLGGYLWGTISHRISNKHVIIATQVTTLAMSGLCILSVLVYSTNIPYMLLYLIALLTGVNMGCWLGFVNYTMDIVSEEDRPVYLVLNSIIIFPFTFLSYFAGIAADILGFVPLFIIGLIASFIGLLLSFGLKYVKFHE